MINTIIPALIALYIIITTVEYHENVIYRYELESKSDVFWWSAFWPIRLIQFVFVFLLNTSFIWIRTSLYFLSRSIVVLLRIFGY